MSDQSQRIERLAFSIPEAAARLGICRASVYNLIKAGGLKPVKILGRTVITDGELRRFLTKLEEEAA